jgi:hypothetical protein
MINFLSKFFVKPKEMAAPIDAQILDDHLSSIKKQMLEIRNYTQKKVTTDPTRIHWRPVDIECAWASSKEDFRTAYGMLSTISLELGAPAASPKTGASFKESLATFASQIDKIIIYLESSNKTLEISQTVLRAIDCEIVKLQQACNLLHRHVVIDYNYPGIPVATHRPMRTEIRNP